MKYSLPFFYDFVFPNYILPNALNPQMAIVDYIHNLHVSGATTDALFERHIGNPSGPMATVFGDSIGVWPTSLRHNGSYLRYPSYKDLVDIDEEALYIGKQKKKKYIYPIKLTPHMHEFIGLAPQGNKINGDYFWKNMSQEALDDVKKGNAIIFLDWANENFVDQYQFQHFHNILSAGNIPPNQVVLAFNSHNAQELYESWFPPEGRRMVVRNWPFMLFHNSWHYNTHPEVRMSIDDFRNSKNKIRDNHAVFKIRRAKSYRLAILFSLATDNLLDRVDWSFLDTNTNFDRALSQASVYPFTYNHDAVREIVSMVPKNLKSETYKFDDIYGWSDKSPEPSRNSYFDITCETYMNESGYQSFTEKVCKPLIHFSPFLFVGFKGALALLRKLGFKTFHPFIDESYDDEPDDIKRLSMIYQEVNRLCSMSKEEIHNWYWAMEDILIHNHQTFLDFCKNDDYNKNLVSYLSDRIKE